MSSASHTSKRESIFRVLLKAPLVQFKFFRRYSTIHSPQPENARTEQNSRNTEGRFRAIFDNALEGILLIGDDRLYVDANPAAHQILGREATDICGRAFGSFLAEPDQALRIWTKMWAEGLYSAEVEVLKPNGSKCEVWLILKRDIQPGVHLSLIRDITVRKSLERQLQHSQKMEAVGRLAGGVAHDFNNMLTVIRGYSELLLRKLPEADPLRRYATSILNAADRSSMITHQLLAFSKRQVIQPQTLVLNSLIAETMLLLRRLIGEDIHLKEVLAPDLGKTRVDPGQIGQILLNLVVNARDAMPDGGCVTIETSNVELDSGYKKSHLEVQPGPYVMLSVTDTGCGMDAPTKSRIFEPFFTTKEQGKGTGLGLATVYGIVRQGGGTIYVYSEPGEGTCFKIYLPRVDCDTPCSTSTLPPGPKGGRRIVLIEDDLEARRLLEQFLVEQGYEVFSSATGAEAIVQCESLGGFDLLLSDVNTPGIGGPDLTGYVAARFPGAKILLMSGFSAESLREQGLFKEGIPFIAKPFQLDDLAGKIEELTAK